MRDLFSSGFNLPPGCTTADIDRAAGADDALDDRAREWVNEHHPDATDEEYERLYHAARADLAAIDAAADEADQGGE